jgi:hypothetical protein
MHLPLANPTGYLSKTVTLTTATEQPHEASSGYSVSFLVYAKPPD